MRKLDLSVKQEADEEMADAADRTQRATTLAQNVEAFEEPATAQHSTELAEGSESPSVLNAECEERMRDLVAKYDANLAELRVAAEEKASLREAQLAQILEPLEVSLQKAVDDFDPGTCETIQAKIDEAKAAAASATANADAFHRSRAAKLEGLLAAQAALAAAESALEEAAEKKLVEARKAMSTKEFTKAKVLKAKAEDLMALIKTTAVGKDDIGNEKSMQMEDEARVLQNAVAEVKRCKEELELIPKTLDAFSEWRAKREAEAQAMQRDAEAKAKQDVARRANPAAAVRHSLQPYSHHESILTYT